MPELLHAIGSDRPACIAERFQLEIVFLFGISLSLLNRSNAVRVWPCSQRVAVLSASGRALSVLLCSQRV